MPGHFSNINIRKRNLFILFGEPILLKLLRLLIISLMITIGGLVGGSVFAAETSGGLASPPAEYRLDDVRVLLTRHPGMRKAPIQQIELSGKGNATLKRDSTSVSFQYKTPQLLDLLNKLYSIRFFELPASYFVQRSIFLKDDGSIGTQIRRMMDAPSSSICFTVSTYEKCVSYGADGPHELRSIEQHLFSEAEYLTKSGVPAK